MSKVSDAVWGNEQAYFNQPPANVPPDAWWISIVFFWLLLPLNLIMALLCVFIDPMFRWIGSLAMFSTLHGRPLWMAWAIWWYQIATALQLLVRSGKSRFTLFSRSRAIYGGGEWWWHGEGVWNCPYKSVRATMASDQTRKPAFGCVSTAVPELFPARMLLFLDGEEHRIVRSLYEEQLLAPKNWHPRVEALSALLAELAPSPCTLAALDRPTVDKMVASAIWFLLFGVRLTAGQAATIAQWGGSGLAGMFVFPRMIHRIAFNLLLRRVKALRIGTLQVFSEHGLQPLAAQMNEALGPHKRPSACALADELMYAVNFAGVGGTQHATWGTLAFLRRTTVDVKPESVTFPPGSLPALYKEDPAAFIKECVRLDAPVTSATCAFAQPERPRFNNTCCGGPKEHAVPAGTLHQYVLSIANRDPAQFDEPNTFNPKRHNLDSMVAWNGALDQPNQYPRICPGQAMSVVVIQSIVGLVQEMR